jgi:prepilin-type N-terminal cleavage/methylation domain-containing protein/prepilin-type processing-associated H-X9-DG protein
VKNKVAESLKVEEFSRVKRPFDKMPQPRYSLRAVFPVWESGGPAWCRGFTLIEMLVVVAIIALLVVLGMGPIEGAIQSANAAKCAGNLHNIGVGLLQYANDNNNCLPQRFYDNQNVGYATLILPYVNNNGAVFICPSLSNPDWPSTPAYGMNWYYDNANLMTVPNLTQTILATDTTGPNGQGSNRADQNSGTPGELAPTRHRGQANYLFFDGHVERLPFSATQTTISTGPQGPVNMWGVDQGNHNQNLAGGAGN